MRTWKKVMLGCLTTFILLLLGTYCWYRYEYPYGRTHCCPIGMHLALAAYAEDHDGKFPAGGATPEASLCLLYPEYVDAATLAGRAKSAEVAKRILESGRPLGPDTCDWHYAEGLTRDDYSDLAILWDKSGLGHTGQNLHGGHEVVRLYGSFNIVPANKWVEFLAEQEKLLAERGAKKP